MPDNNDRRPRRLRLRFPRYAYNRVSALGASIAAIVGFTLLVLLGLSFFVEQQNPYFGIFIYMVLPPMFIGGLVMIPLGMYREWRRRQNADPDERPDRRRATWPVLDLNNPRHRNAAMVFTFGTVVALMITAVGSYGAYHYSESVEFCGTTCHQVMEPEHVTYQNSPHARVTCASCHVGPGAGWFVKSKLSGIYQIYASMAEVYPRPIPTPIESLRPARETCEQCHWPERVFGAQQREIHHYMYDEENTHWPINLLIKTGGGDPVSGQTAGIHWHMNIGVDVEYIARDERRQDIPWIRVEDRRTGRVTVYQDSENPISEEEFAAGKRRTMDCMDCHNRPSHIFRSPDYAIDEAILKGKISADLPDIKRLAVEVMADEYETKEEALRTIANRITDHYRQQDFYADSKVPIDKAILGIQEAYSTNIFPAMNASWGDYPNNIGHFENKGCMRCHGGNHVSDDGIALTRDCTACHTILSQGPPADASAILAPNGEETGDSMAHHDRVAEFAIGGDGLEFKHPEDIDEMWRDFGCYECHTGVQP